MNGKAFTKEEDDLIFSLIQKGVSRSEICNSFNRPYSSVNYRIWKLGLKTVKNKDQEIIELINKGKTSSEIAKELKLNKQFICNKINLMKYKGNAQYKNYWSKVEINQLQELVDKGYTRKRIYEAIPNRTPYNIDFRLDLMYKEKTVNGIIEPKLLEGKITTYEKPITLGNNNSDNMKIIQQILDSGKKAIIIL